MPLDLFTEGDPIADTKAPADVPIGERWSTRRFRARLVNPANRRKLSVIIVGTGLAGGSAAATRAVAGYRFKSFWFQDSPRRAHSVAAQGGINAAKNYRNDGDSVHRLFYVVSMILLGLHLRHGIFAATQTLGQTNKRRERAVNGIAYVVSGLITVGFILVPLSIAFGLID